jgi:hypothetical protein
MEIYRDFDASLVEMDGDEITCAHLLIEYPPKAAVLACELGQGLL